MTSLNKPAGELLIDLINASALRVNAAWTPLSYGALLFAAPATAPRDESSHFKNSSINVYNADDTTLTSPHTLYYDRVEFLDLCNRYQNELILYIPSSTTTVQASDFITTLNLTASLQLTVGDLLAATTPITQFPQVVTITANPTSKIYCGSGPVTVSTPTEHVVDPEFFEASALAVSMLSNLAAVSALPANQGYILSYGYPAFSRISEYVERYTGPGSVVKQQTRYYSRKSELLETIGVEPVSVIQLDTTKHRNFTGNPNDYIDRVCQIDNELCLITDLTFSAMGATVVESLTVRRGLDDTIPVEHSAGSKLRIIRNDSPTGMISTNNNTNIAVRLLSKIGNDVEAYGGVDLLPTQNFSNRLGRPYPPRNVRVNGKWDSTIQARSTETEPDVWEHRYDVTWDYHPKLVAGQRVVDTLGWFEHGYYPTNDAGVEFQITVYIAGTNTPIYTSSRTTARNLSFVMPAYAGNVRLEVKSLIMGTSCYQTPTVDFHTGTIGAAFAPVFGSAHLIEQSDRFVLDVDVATDGFPKATTVFTELTVPYAYSVSWESQTDGVWTEFATNTNQLLFDNYIAQASLPVRAVVTMTNAQGTVTLTTAPETLPAS